jgi:hypothetical protein
MEGGRTLFEPQSNGAKLDFSYFEPGPFLPINGGDYVDVVVPDGSSPMGAK